MKFDRMNLRISINAKQIEGPWGGGAHSVRNLERYFRAQGHYVTRNLEPGLDAILLHSLRAQGDSTSFAPEAVVSYRQRYPNTIVVTRVNTCDEHQTADRGLNRAVLRAAELADAVVFVSEFSRDLFRGHGLNPAQRTAIIRTGTDRGAFYPNANLTWSPPEKMRLVTHHWSSWVMKGIDVYERLDFLLGEAPWSDLIEFTHIGKLPLGFQLPNSRTVPVMFGDELTHELQRHHAYLTGARHEAAGNHYIEAVACGLPVLYLESGANAEYCAPFGVGFHPGNFERKLKQFYDEYATQRAAALTYSYDAEQMAAEYLKLLETLVAERRESTSREKNALSRWRWPAWPIRSKRVTTDGHRQE